MMRLDDSTLVSFVDGELDAAAIREVALALESDPEAAEKVRQFRISAALVRTAFRDPQHLQVSPALARAIEAWPQLTPRAPPPRVGRRFAIALAASVAGAVIVGFAMRGGSPPASTAFADRLLQDVADYHVLYAREDEHLVEVPAERREHIEAWLGDL